MALKYNFNFLQYCCRKPLRKGITTLWPSTLNGSSVKYYHRQHHNQQQQQRECMKRNAQNFNPKGNTFSFNKNILHNGRSLSNFQFDLLFNQKCYYSSQPEPRKDPFVPKKPSFPELMSFPEIIWPSIIKSVKNWILVHFIIKPYFDQEFNLPDFIFGTKQALEVVSSKLASGDMDSVKDLITQDAIEQLKTVISKMSIAQRFELAIKKEDVYLSFPYQIGIMFEETDDKVQKRWVEITMVFHALRGLKELQEKGEPPGPYSGFLSQYRDKISICNYRFIKEFTQGHESDWTINIINHFKPSDRLEE